MALSTAVPSDSTPSAFTRSLEGFRRRLSAEDLENFEFTSFESLELAIKEIQKDQAQRRALRNLNKIKPFLCFLRDYARVIEQFVSAKPDFLAFIWVRINASPSSSLPSTDISKRGPSSYAFKCGLFLLSSQNTQTNSLKIASRFEDAFDALLNAYARIGEALPIFSAIDELNASRRHGHIKQILADVYEDILIFHRRALVFFKQPGWSPIVPRDAYSNGFSMEDSLSHYYPLIRRQIRRRSQKSRKVQRTACPKRRYLAIQRGPGYSDNHHSTVRGSDRARETPADSYYGQLAFKCLMQRPSRNDPREAT